MSGKTFHPVLVFLRSFSPVYTGNSRTIEGAKVWTDASMHLEREKARG